MYQVNHYAYCGMSGIPACHDERDSARRYAAARLRRYRKRFPVVILERGKAWEICEPEGCAMVPDACGTLRIAHITHECRECGFEHESREEALHCCADYGDCE